MIAADQILAKEEIEAAKKRAELDRKVTSMVQDVLWHVILLILMCWVIYGNQNANAYTQTKHMKDLFVNDFPEVHFDQIQPMIFFY